MNTEHLFIALSKTLLESCGQAMLVWLALKACSLLDVRLSPRRLSVAEASTTTSSKNHYLVKYGAFVLVFTSFIATLIYHVTQTPRSFLPSAYGYLQSASFVQTSAGTETSYLSITESFLGAYSKWITLFYIAGLAIHTIWLLTGYFQVRNMAKHSSHQKDNFWENRLEKLVVKLGITKKVKLYLSGINEIPFTTGYLKPIILFPLAAVNQLTLAQVEAILLHELAHIKRNDYLFNLIQQVMKTFLFFNPFAWLIEREIQREREYCCDDIVVEHSGEPETYATALLILEENRRISPSFALASNNRKKYPLLYRIKRLMMTTPNSSPFPKLPIAILTLAIVLSVAWAIPGSGLKKLAKKADEKNSAFKASSVIIPMHDEFIAVPARSLTKKKPLQSGKADTIPPAKKKIKIVIEDEKGTKTEYTSVDEMPADVKEEFLTTNFKPGTINKGFKVFAKQLPDKSINSTRGEFEIEFEPFIFGDKKPEGLTELRLLEEKRLTNDATRKAIDQTAFRFSPEYKKRVAEVEEMQNNEHKEQVLKWNEMKVAEEKQITIDTLAKSKKWEWQLTTEFSASQLKRLQTQLKQNELNAAQLKRAQSKLKEMESTNDTRKKEVKDREDEIKDLLKRIEKEVSNKKEKPE